MWEIEDQLNGRGHVTAASVGTGPLAAAVPQRTAMMNSVSQSSDVMTSLASIAASMATIYAISNGHRP